MTCVTPLSAIFISRSISSGGIGTPQSAPISRTRYTSFLLSMFERDVAYQRGKSEARGRWREVSIWLWPVVVLFVIFFAISPIEDWLGVK